MMDDVDRIMAVMERSFDPAFGEAWTRRQVSDALAIPGTRYGLIGPAGIGPGEGEAAGFTLSRAVFDEEELLLLAVLPQYRGRGLGDLLLTMFLNDARERGMRRAFLEMRDGNAAEALYRRHGFVSVGRRRDYYRRGSGAPLDAITFALKLERSMQ